MVDVHKDAGLLHRPARREREGLMDNCPDNDVDRLMFAALIRYLARPVGHQSDRRLLGLEQLIFFQNKRAQGPWGERQWLASAWCCRGLYLGLLIYVSKIRG